MTDLFAALAAEIAVQDLAHPQGYPPDRDGLRMGVASLEDEVREVWQDWNTYKKRDGWGGMEAELLQVAGIAMRMLRGLRGSVTDRIDGTGDRDTRSVALDHAMYTVWLDSGKWRWTTECMTTEAREAAVAAVLRYDRVVNFSALKDRACRKAA